MPFDDDKKFSKAVYPFLKDAVDKAYARGGELGLKDQELREYAWAVVMRKYVDNFTIVKAFMDHDLEEYKKTHPEANIPKLSL